jgi:hypothetical protein
MWGSRHRKMVCQVYRGDGRPEGRQEAVPPESTAQQGSRAIRLSRSAMDDGSAVGGQESARGFFMFVTGTHPQPPDA